MSDFAPGLPTEKTLVFTDNNGRQFTASFTVNSGPPGADGDASGALPLTGGTLSGPLTIGDGAQAATPWSAGPVLMRQIGGKQLYAYPQINGNGDIQLLLGNIGVNVPFVLSPAPGVIVSPQRRTLIEDNTNNLKPIMVQRFTVQGFNSSYIAFPQSFTADDVRVIIPSFFDGSNFVVCGTTLQHPADRNGFTLSKWNAGPNTGWDNSTSSIDIIAIGEG